MRWGEGGGDASDNDLKAVDEIGAVLVTMLAWLCLGGSVAGAVGGFGQPVRACRSHDRDPNGSFETKDIRTARSNLQIPGPRFESAPRKTDKKFRTPPSKRQTPPTDSTGPPETTSRRQRPVATAGPACLIVFGWPGCRGQPEGMEGGRGGLASRVSAKLGRIIDRN